ncbi:hypothetical protein D3C80_1280470 [compost metagenome]
MLLDKIKGVQPSVKYFILSQINLAVLQIVQKLQTACMVSRLVSHKYAGEMRTQGPVNRCDVNSAYTSSFNFLKQSLQIILCFDRCRIKAAACCLVQNLFVIQKSKGFNGHRHTVYFAVYSYIIKRSLISMTNPFLVRQISQFILHNIEFAQKVHNVRCIVGSIKCADPLISVLSGCWNQ